jgi:hypothetical protein
LAINQENRTLDWSIQGVSLVHYLFSTASWARASTINYDYWKQEIWWKSYCTTDGNRTLFFANTVQNSPVEQSWQNESQYLSKPAMTIDFVRGILLSVSWQQSEEILQDFL